MDAIILVIVVLCGMIGLDRRGRWWHAAIVVAAAAMYSAYTIYGFRMRAGLRVDPVMMIAAAGALYAVAGAAVYAVARLVRNRLDR